LLPPFNAPPLSGWPADAFSAFWEVGQQVGLFSARLAWRPTPQKPSELLAQKIQGIAER
jgi:hypothetical protein